MSLLSKAASLASGTWWLKLLPYLAIVLAVVGVLRIAERHGYHSRDSEVAALDTTIANVRIAAAQAQADDAAHKAKIETADATISKETNDALAKQLADARAAAASYGARLRAASRTDQGGQRDAPMSGAPDPASAAAGAGTAPELAQADLDACSIAVVKAEGWRTWYEAVAAVPGR